MMTLSPLKSLKTLSSVYSSGSQVESNRSRILERKKERENENLLVTCGLHQTSLCPSPRFITGIHFLVEST